MSLPSAPMVVRIFSMPAMKPSAGLPGVLGVLVVTSSPESSSRATTSVNVPPVSMPILIRRLLMRSIQPLVRRREPRQFLPTDRRFAGRCCDRVGAPSVLLAQTRPAQDRRRALDGMSVEGPSMTNRARDVRFAGCPAVVMIPVDRSAARTPVTASPGGCDAPRRTGVRRVDPACGAIPPPLAGRRRESSTPLRGPPARAPAGPFPHTSGSGASSPANTGSVPSPGTLLHSSVHIRSRSPLRLSGTQGPPPGCPQRTIAAGVHRVVRTIRRGVPPPPRPPRAAAGPRRGGRRAGRRREGRRPYAPPGRRSRGSR
jgi:hypothetical protein